MSAIQNFNKENFLTEYWQQKPLLIKSAFPGYHTPVSAEELAGLACEDFIESRIITEQEGAQRWHLENGPFTEHKFTSMPAENWTLLIQGINKVIPELDDMLHNFNFIPGWRLDDLMASYAAPGGSVGPHIDQYDVFLLQASGQRKWMISEATVNNDNFVEDIPLSIIKDFESESEWILNPGDMLYLPPGVSHYGIGMENCITFSIGFRAPSHSELLSDFVDHQLANLDESDRYKDPQIQSKLNHGEITPDVINQVQTILLSQFHDREIITDWFTQFITEYHSENEIYGENNLSCEKFAEQFKTVNEIRRPATVRAYYYHSDENKMIMYINGNKQDIDKENFTIAQIFCNQHKIRYSEFLPHEFHFLKQLYNKGYLEFPDE